MQQTQNQEAGGTANELRSDAQQLKSKAADRLHSEVDARKGAAVSQAQSVSSAIEKTAGELDDAPEWLKSTLQKGAQQIQRFADSLEQKDSRQLLNEAQQFARQNPGTFLAACAAAGFAAARILKAGSQQGDTSSSSYQAQWDDDVEVGGVGQQSFNTSPTGEYV